MRLVGLLQSFERAAPGLQAEGSLQVISPRCPLRRLAEPRLEDVERHAGFILGAANDQ